MSDPDESAGGDAPAIPGSPLVADGDGTRRPPARRRRGRRRWPTVVLALVVVIAAGLWIASRISLDQYALTPGNAAPVSQYISVPADLDHPLTGKILLTDVYVSQLNALSYLHYRFFDPDSQIYRASEILGSAPTPGQYLNESYLQMVQAQSFATAAALAHLGYMVSSTNVGALVYGVPANSPASRSLRVAQVITAVDGTATPTDCALSQALHGRTPGTDATLRVEDSSINSEGAFVPGPTVTRSVTLGAPPKGLVEYGCGAPMKPTAYLGVLTQTQQNWHFPVQVKIDTPEIGGPSAGLAMTLGIIDKLSGGRLTGGRVVAATGTMDQYGDVGDVGGVPQKTVAVEDAGATVFFVPPPELKNAESKATPQLKVYAVSNLDQVLGILERLGGSLPRRGEPVQAAP